MFLGGVKQIKLSDDETFTEPVGETFLITIEKYQLIQEGQTYPVPVGITAALADDTEAPTGVNLPFEIRAANLSTEDVQSLEDAAYGLVPVYVKYTSLDGKTEMVLLKAILNQVNTGPINERGSLGFVRVAGMCTGTRPADCYTVTEVAP